jgi:hypothetical protein
MRSFHTLIFDDVVEGTTAVYSPPGFDDTLGAVDALSLCASASQVTGTSPTLTVQVEQSPDERRWSNGRGLRSDLMSQATSAVWMFAA